MHKNMFSCISNDSIDIIPDFVHFFCIKFDIYSISHLKYNCDLHQIYKLDIFVQPSVHDFYCLNFWICLKHL